MNIVYAKHREKLLTQQFNWNTAVIKMMMVSGEYVADEAHQFVSDIPAIAILARSGAFTSKDATDGYARGIPPEFLLLRASTPIAGALLYVDTGNDATSELICYTNDGPAFPLAAVGFNYAVTYNAALGGFYRA